MKKEFRQFKTHLEEEAKKHKMILEKLIKRCKEVHNVDLLKQTDNSVEKEVKMLLKQELLNTFNNLLKDDCTSGKKEAIRVMITNSATRSSEMRYYRKYKKTIDFYMKYRSQSVTNNLKKLM